MSTEGWLMLNVDASGKDDWGVGLGLVGRSHNGEVLSCGSKRW